MRCTSRCVAFVSLIRSVLSRVFRVAGGTRGALARQAGAAARKDKETIRQERPCTRESGMPMLQQIEMVPLEAASVGSTPRGQQLKEAAYTQTPISSSASASSPSKGSWETAIVSDVGSGVPCSSAIDCRTHECINGQSGTKWLDGLLAAPAHFFHEEEPLGQICLLLQQVVEPLVHVTRNVLLLLRESFEIRELLQRCRQAMLELHYLLVGHGDF